MSVAVPMVRALFEVVERAGVPRREFLKAVGLLEHRLSGGDRLFTLKEFDDMQRVQEAAVATGFSDCTAFHRAFKHWTGVTPAEFQRRSPPSH